MGFAAGFSAGVSAQRERRKAEEAQSSQELSNRRLMLQEAEKNYKYNQETKSLDRTQVGQSEDEVKLTELQAQNKVMQSKLAAMEGQTNATTIKNILVNWIDGKYSDSIKEFKTNPLLREKLNESFNVSDIRPIIPEIDNGVIEEVTKGQDLTPEQADVYKKSIIMVQDKDSLEWKPQTIAGLIKETGTMQYMSQSEKDNLIKIARNNEAILKGAGLTSGEQELQDKATNLKSKYLSGTAAAYESGDMDAIFTEYLKQNPNAVATMDKTKSGRRDMLKQLMTAYARAKGKTIETLSPDELMEGSQLALTKLSAGAAQVKENADIKDMSNIIKSNKEMFANGTYDESKAIHNETSYIKQAEGKEKTVLGDTQAKLVNSSLVVKQIDDILSGSAIPVDKDVVANAKTYLYKLLGKENDGTFDNVRFDTEVGMVLASYIKDRSGTAASDRERDFLTNLLTGGSLTDEVYQKKALSSFRDFIVKDNKQLATSYSDKLPYSANKLLDILEPSKKSSNSPYKPGQVVKGYKFLGGNYKDKNNWEKVN